MTSVLDGKADGRAIRHAGIGDLNITILNDAALERAIPYIVQSDEAS